MAMAGDGLAVVLCVFSSFPHPLPPNSSVLFPTFGLDNSSCFFQATTAISLLPPTHPPFSSPNLPFPLPPRRPKISFPLPSPILFRCQRNICRRHSPSLLAQFSLPSRPAYVIAARLKAGKFASGHAVGPPLADGALRPGPVLSLFGPPIAASSSFPLGPMSIGVRPPPHLLAQCSRRPAPLHPPPSEPFLPNRPKTPSPILHHNISPLPSSSSTAATNPSNKQPSPLHPSFLPSIHHTPLG